MDERILRTILYSCESVTKDLENSSEYKKLLEKDKFLPSNDIFNGLCLSLTKLLSYKVSKEAYQRYTVRLRVIVCMFCIKVYKKKFLVSLYNLFIISGCFTRMV